jgi:hypothetical protein
MKIFFTSTNALFFFLFLFALLAASSITASPLFIGSKITPSIQKAYSIPSTAAPPHTQLPSPHSSSTTTQSKLPSTPATHTSGHSSTPTTTKPTAIAPRANPTTAKLQRIHLLISHYQEVVVQVIYSSSLKLLSHHMVL